MDSPRRTWLLLPLLLVALACAARAPESVATRPESAAPAIADGIEERSLLLLLADRKLFEPEALGVLLDGPPALREALAVALGRIGDPRGRSMLQGLLVDAAPEVRRAAAFALGELGAAEAVAALRSAAVDDDPETGALAVEALGKLAAPLDDVRRILTALAPDEAARRLAPHLFRFRDDGRVAAARELLASEDTRVRAGAAYALGRDARPEALEDLRRLLGDADPFVRAWAARGLGGIGGAEDLGRLLELARASESSCRIQAIAAAGRIAERVDLIPPESWQEELLECLSDPLPGVRAAALEAAARFRSTPALERELAKRFRTGPQRERELALRALAGSGSAEAASRVAEAAASADPVLRAAAAATAVGVGEEALLGRLAADAEAAVRRAALEAELALAGDDAATPARRGLADPDPTVRATALDHLAGHPALDAEELIAALRRAATDRELDARLSALRALAARCEASPAERSVGVEALQEVARDPEYLVRREAGDALAGLGYARPPATPIETRRPVATYRAALEQASSRPLFEVATDRGSFRIRLDCPEAPLTCLSFWKLAEQGFFDGLAFHRVVPDFVVQGGDPRGDGWGGPGYSLRDEINRLRFVRGAVGMALSGPDTGGSQFFVTLSPQPHLDGGFTVFGSVVEGMERLDRIEQGDRIRTVRRVD
ncbi:MAG: HEAT repeat domain-containing protein [Holophagales bacterium]|nr:HEAT repeat domain-containing protein [Holophagales bacterium]